MQPIIFISATVLGLSTASALAQTTTLIGRPTVKVSEGGSDRAVEKLSDKQSADHRVVITQNGEQFFWASRKNAEMIRVVSGSYVTFIAKNGSGYVRTLTPEMFRQLRQLPKAEQEREQFHYVEHLTLMLGSVTYFGKIE